MVDSNDIRTYYTWRDRTVPGYEAFVALQFPDNPITPTRVVVYCLRSQNLHVHELRKVRHYYSTTESTILLPDNKIRDADFDENDFVITESGRTSE